MSIKARKPRRSAPFPWSNSAMRQSLSHRLLAVTLLAVPVCAQAPAGTRLPGARADGSILLPNGWKLEPHGRQIPLASDLPIRLAWHPGGRFLAVQHAGYRDHRVVIVDTKAGADGKPVDRVVGKLSLGKTWSGMAWSNDGERLFVSGGVEDFVHVFEFDAETGRGKPAGNFRVGKPNQLDLVAGMCADAKGRLFVCLQRSNELVVLGADGAVRRTIDLGAGAFPFECVTTRDGDTVYVSLWGNQQVRAFAADTGDELFRVKSGEHPSEMLVSPDGKRLFVSNGNANTVSVIDLERRRVEETLASSLYPLAPPGSTPNSVALDPGGKILVVANADNNNCAVLDVSERGRAKGLGFIPLGAYPTSIRWSPDGKRLYVANGKGSVGSRANPKGPQPRKGHVHSLDDYSGSMFTGSLSTFPFPTPRELGQLSARAYSCSPLGAASEVRGTSTRPQDSPIPAKVGDPSPIRYCVYIIKENRTYDQVLGDIERGNGDTRLCLFPKKVTPNHHAIVDQFVLLDNFYVESEVSADGHEWTMGAYATDFVERTWPVTYGGKGGAKQKNGHTAALGYPAEGHFRIAAPKHGYLFDAAKRAGISYRSYGEFVGNARKRDGDGHASIRVLEGHFDPKFRSFDLDYRDVDRARRFLAELAEFDKKGELPRLIVLRLPSDHTSGTRLGKPTPRAYVADNDLALGRVLEGLSRTQFWKSMAVFVVEDDAQNGPDHVDAHRTVALVAGPHVKRDAHVRTMYSTCSMLRTIELILGLPPMSQFDAAALPMYDCFTGKHDATPYACLDATWPLDEVNKRSAWGRERSRRFDLSREDAADDLALNEVIWRSIKGADSPMPMPRRAAFVRIFD